MALLLANVRTPAEREGDLAAQIAACRTGERRLTEIVAKYGAREVASYGRHLLDYSAEMMRAALREMPSGIYSAEDFLDGDGVSDGPLRIRARIEIGRGRATVDFSGSSPQCAGNVNAVEAITISAVYYVFRCLLAGRRPSDNGTDIADRSHRPGRHDRQRVNHPQPWPAAMSRRRSAWSTRYSALSQKPCRIASRPRARER